VSEPAAGNAVEIAATPVRAGEGFNLFQDRPADTRALFRGRV
jgi:hypothetical protein